jgi:nucleotide-binding universal stress UspA family protein
MQTKTHTQTWMYLVGNSAIKRLLLKGDHTMFQRILVPLDGSSRSERAIAVAARLARASGGAIILVRVVNKSNAFWLGKGQATILAERVIQDDVFSADQYLTVIAASPELQDVPTETLVHVGSTIPAILDAANTSKADLILLCSHGYTGLTRRIMGSVAQKLAREAPIPVLVLRDDGSVPGELLSGTTRPLRALVPLDGSAQAKSALEPAAYVIAALAGNTQGALHLMRIVQPVNTTIEEGGMLTASEKARKYLSMTAGHIREGYVAPAVARFNLAVTWSVAVDSYVAETLINAAETVATPEWGEMLGDIDIIALASRGHNGFQRWVMGSVTEHILLDTKLPLLVVPPDWQHKIAGNGQDEGEGISEMHLPEAVSIS